MVRDIIFIAGIHGCGTTTICEKIYKATNINYYTCSSLIKKIDNKLLNDNTKNVPDINKNQDILLESIKQNVNENYILLDGHFTLMNNQGYIKRVPIETFVKLPISLIIVVTRKPEDIALSLLKRDGKIYNLEFIKEFQKQEISYAKEIAKRLNIEFIQYKENDLLDNLIKVVKIRTSK